MKKGDIVKIKAKVYSVRSGNSKKLRKIEFPTPFTGIVLGWSFLHTGKLKQGRHYDESNYLISEKRHKVFVVEPIEQHKSWLFGGLQKTNRYLEPVRCFEDDLEKIAT